MPKPPNLSNPVAAIKTAMEMKLEDFAQFVGHGVAMLKQVQAGRKPMSDELADKIHLATGVSHRLLCKAKWTARDRKKFVPNTIGTAAFGGYREVAPLLILPEVMATYFALLAEGVNPELALIPLRREIDRTVARWNIDPARWSALRMDFDRRLFAVSGDEQGKSKPFSDTITNYLAESEGFQLAQRLVREWSRRMDDTAKAARSMKPNRIFQQKMANEIWSQMDRARSKRLPAKSRKV
jgi:hypothetical protein